MTPRTPMFVLVVAAMLFVLPVGASPQSVNAPVIGPTLPYQTSPAYLEGARTAAELLRQRQQLENEQALRAQQWAREDETALAAIRTLVQMCPASFRPEFLNTLTPAAAPAVLPIVQAQVRECLTAGRGVR